jgi:hypothetical protein
VLVVVATVESESLFASRSRSHLLVSLARIGRDSLFKCLQVSLSVVPQVRRIDGAGFYVEASFGAQMLLQFLLVRLLLLNLFAV